MSVRQFEAPSDEFFPILNWDRVFPNQPDPLVHPLTGLSDIPDCGFTLLGFPLIRHIPICQEIGEPVLICGDVSGKQWGTLTDQKIDEEIRLLVNETSQAKNVIGYYIADEPSAALFPALGKAVAAVKKYAPGKLAYINLFPDYARIGNEEMSQLGTPSYTEYLERFVDEVQPQLLSYDNYRVQYSMDFGNLDWGASYFRNLLEVRRVALERNLEFWHIVSSNQIRPFTTIPSPANLLLQAYTTLAFGSTGLTWYTYYARGYGYAPVNKHGNRTLTWSYLKMVNEQIKTLGPTMNKLRSTGVFFTEPPIVEGLPVLPGRLIEKLDSQSPALVGEFSHEDGTDYFMLVNLSLERSSLFSVKTPGEFPTMEVVSVADGSLLPFPSEQGIWLPAGQGVLVKISRE